MLDGTEYFECSCGSPEHTLSFTLDEEDNLFYTHVYLNQYRNVFKRIWVAVKYVFGYKCKYGHWDCFILSYDDTKKMRSMLDRLEKQQKGE